MKLSLTRKRGFTQVRGGRPMRVIKTHQVSTKGLSDEQEREFDGSVFAEPGDLALEILGVKSKRLCSYTYLSGQALQLNSYTADDKWFEPGSMARFVIPMPTPGDKDFWVNLTKQLMDIKYGADDLAVFRYICAKHEPPMDVARAITKLFDRYETTTDQVAKTHMMGIVEAKGGGGVEMHFQPPADAAKHAATSFQVALALRSREA